MSIIGWLSGRDQERDRDIWSISEAGNPTRELRGMRLTVFQRDGGWKYCISKVEEDDAPYFSDPYSSSEAAQYEAIARLEGLPQKYRSNSVLYEERRLSSTNAYLQGLVASKADALAALQDPAAKLATIRKLEAQVASALKALPRMQRELYIASADADLKIAENLLESFKQIAPRLESKAVEIKGRPRSLTPPSS